MRSVCTYWLPYEQRFLRFWGKRLAPSRISELLFPSKLCLRMIWKYEGLCYLRMEVTRSMQRVGEQTIWKDFANSSVGVSESASRRSLGVVYLKARIWLAS
jgi:hypothetical protein